MISRAENARRVAELDARGLSAKGIVKETGLSRSYVLELLSDPSGERVRARKASYRGVCESCGGPTDGSNGRDAAPRRCRECYEWSDEEIIAAIRKWATGHAGKPPTTTEWRHASAEHPSGRTLVQGRGWNEFLLAAGFELSKDRRPETQAEIERLIAEGHAVGEVAERFGWTPGNISQRLARRGKSARSLRADGERRDA